MNRSLIINKGGRKTDPRMPFGLDTVDILSGYLSPQLHKSLRQLTSTKKRKTTHE